MQEQQEDNSTDDIYYLGNIIFTELNNPLSPKLERYYPPSKTSANNTFLDLPNSSDDTQPHSIIAK